MPEYQIINGDCVLAMRGMPDNSVDAVVCDPPYELGFMGKTWDNSGIAYRVDMWREALRVLKPGGHLLAFSGSRTYHRMVVAIEDAGFEVRDQIMWVYGSGFPKSLDVSKAIDKAAGAEREPGVPGRYAARRPRAEVESVNAYADGVGDAASALVTAPATDAARQWSGWGTALKPAHEPICVARKPLVGTVAANVLAFGTGALNIDGCRVPSEKATGWGGGGSALYEGGLSRDGGAARPAEGRWPANIIHSGLQEEWARYFYCAKASKADRNEGCESMPLQVAGGMSGRSDGSMGSVTYNKNVHPTVKPTDLMAYLVRLVTPPGGVVLDPFMGSGSTGKACMREGFRFIGCELSAEYAAIAEARILHELYGDIL